MALGISDLCLCSDMGRNIVPRRREGRRDFEFRLEGVHLINVALENFKQASTLAALRALSLAEGFTYPTSSSSKSIHTTFTSSLGLRRGDKVSDDESDNEWDACHYEEDGMTFAPALNTESDMKIDGEDDCSLDSICLDDEVLLEKLLTQLFA
ncbi:hypothetical protein DFH09DRAFT_1095187 [Mycena vulgaris]|nr:hypothetical protein DFH09DRAFT_1095187 [Mycena vulgaris]